MILFLLLALILPANASAPGFRKWAPGKEVWYYQIRDFGGLEPFVKDIADRFSYIPGCSLFLIKTEYHPDIIVTLWDDLEVPQPEVTNVTYRNGYINFCRLNLNAKELESAPSGKNRDNYYINSISHGLVHCFWGPPHLSSGLMKRISSTDQVYWKNDPAKDILRSLYPDE